MQLLLATRKRVGNPSFRAAETEIGDENMRRGISYLEPPANLVSCKWEFLPCKSLKGKRLQHGDPSWLALSLRSPLITLGMTNWRFHFPIMHHFFKSHRLTYFEPRDYRVVFGIQQKRRPAGRLFLILLSVRDGIISLFSYIIALAREKVNKIGNFFNKKQHLFRVLFVLYVSL